MARNVLETQTQKFLDELAAKGGPQIYELSIADARGVLEDAQTSPATRPDVKIQEQEIPGPQGTIKLRILRPKRAKANQPTIVYFHGGGWVLGSANTHDRLMRELANGVPATVVFVDFTRSPEGQFPRAIEEAYAVTKWMADNGAPQIIVAGDSAGGNMAAVVTQLAKKRGGPKIESQVLFYPVTDASFDTASYSEFAEGYFLTREAMKWFWSNYIPDEGERRDPTASPLQASVDSLTGLPPALVITGENDVLRDEGEAYARKLMEAGVNVTATRYLGTIHDFVMLNVLSETPAARGAIAQACEWIRAHAAPMAKSTAVGM